MLKKCEFVEEVMRKFVAGKLRGIHVTELILLFCYVSRGRFMTPFSPSTSTDLSILCY